MNNAVMTPWQAAVPIAGQAQGALLHALLDALWDSAAPPQVAAVLRATGERWARATPLDGLRSNVEIMAAINAFWAECGWGHAGIAFSDGGLLIDHAGLPAAGALADDRWNCTVVAVLTGAYDQWLASLAGDATRRVRVVAMEEHGVKLLYGA